MSGHASTAAKDESYTLLLRRAHKQAHPELYCADPSCLWRTGGPRGTPCQKHPTVGAFKAPDVRWPAREFTMHLRALADPGTTTTSLRGILGRAECGVSAPLDFIANEPELVTCRDCLRALILRNAERMWGKGPPDIPTLTPITARPVDLNPEAWGEEEPNG